MERLPPEILARVIFSDTCWFWTGEHRKHDGRPVFNKKYVYRITYAALIGEIPAGRILHHRVCQDKKCINPWHTVPLTQSEHMVEHAFGGDERVGQSLKTQCPSGHPYTLENTRLTISRDGSRERSCRTCLRLRARNRYRDNREENQRKAREYQARKRAELRCA